MEIPGYEIIRELGKGGMATVYLATQLSFDRKAAVKVMAPALVADEAYGQRFLREAKIVAKLSHPHIVPVFDVGVVGEYHYISMEHLTGGDLSDWIKSGITVAEAVTITEQISKALHYANSKGYVHRDIKPDNIMFREDNSAVLTDFGIARPQISEEQYTMSGTVVGTPKYMAPEQARGLEVDGRADLYSLGVVFYEMLMDKVPYDGNDPMAIGIMHIRDPIPKLPKELAYFQGFLNKVMAKKPEDRYKNGMEMAKAIREVFTNKPDITDQPMAIDTSQLSLADVQTPHTEVTGSNHTITELQLPTQLTHSEETIKKMGGLSKKYHLKFNMVCEDTSQFGVQFSKATTLLLEWYDERQNKSAGVEFHVTSGVEIEDRAAISVSNLCSSGEPFDFLEKIPVTLYIYDGSQNLLKTLQFGKQ